MKTKAFNRNRLKLAVLMLAGSGLASSAAHAVDLMAYQLDWMSPDGPVPMWGYFNDTGDCNVPPAVNWTTGPEITGPMGGSLTVNLRNCLSEPVSMIIPGQTTTLSPETITDAAGRTRVSSFTTSTAPNGGVGVYTWNNLKFGTYLYQSGTNPALQVQMGLYGALKVGSYLDFGSSADVTLLFSEIDPDLHTPPTAANPKNYSPSYYLVNGEVANGATQPIISVGDTLLPTGLRLLNAGLDSRVPALNGGELNLIFEDGNFYPNMRVQNSALLAAGKTLDALWLPEAAGSYTLYDRGLSGARVALSATAGTGAPIANPDAYTMDEGTVLNVPSPGVKDNDVPSTGVFAIVTSSTTNGVLAFNGDGSFSYTPNDPDFFGVDSFQYLNDDNSSFYQSAPTTVTITVNNTYDQPSPVDDLYEVASGSVLNIPSRGVLANDSDPDQAGAFDAVLVAGPTNATAFNLNPDGSFDYSSNVVGSDSFTYQLSDTTSGLMPATATVMIDVVAANTPPVANPNSYVTDEGVAVSGNVITDAVPDSDPDGHSLTVVASTTPTNGQLVMAGNGVFTYTPNQNFNGLDSFNYTIDDGNGGQDSATVDIAVNSVNSAPVAIEDNYTGIPRNTNTATYVPVFLAITANDTDADGNLAPVTAGQITLTTGAETSRRGTLNVVNGGVEYTPRRLFRGTDTFNYTVTDQAGSTSNEVTVRINVVR